MSDDEPDRQRLEDMLESSTPGTRAGGGGDDAPAEPSGDGSAASNGAAPATQRAPDAPSPAEPAAEDDPRPASPAGNGATMLKAALVCGAISIPAAIIPFAGMLLGIVAIVLGVKVGRAAADGRAKVAIALGAAGLVLSIVLFAVALASA